MEIKNKLTVTRGEGEGCNGETRGRVVQELVQRTLGQRQWGWGRGLNVGGRKWVGQGRVMGEKGGNCN